MLRVVAEKSFSLALKKLGPDQRAAVLATLRDVPATFGRPHAHAGIGLRQLRRGLFEVRIGFQLRVLSVRDGDLLIATTVGSHDDIRRYLRARA